MTKQWICTVAAALVFGTGLAQAQTVTKETLTGVTNFAKLDTTIACAGATSGAALRSIGSGMLCAASRYLQGCDRSGPAGHGFDRHHTPALCT